MLQLKFVGWRLRLVSQPSGCLLLPQIGVFLLPILLFEIKKVSNCEIRWLRRLRHRRNAFWCQKLRSTAHPAVALWDSQDDTLAQIFVLNSNSSVSMKRTVSRLIFTPSAIILTVNLRSNGANSLTHAVLSPVSVFVCCPLHCSSSKTVLPSGVPRNFVRGGGVQQFQLRTEDRENGDLWAIAP